ncbi:MAG: GTP 3',8-cyclase MoaA [Desulfurococcales archaeon]|nr:GTP 3',8-cyclase MoaA [Desulfurococcales archaeon]
MVLKDGYGRPLLNLRVIVTDECNYRCLFCHIEGEPLDSPIQPGMARSLGYLSLDEYSLVAEAASRVGISKVKFTGGEPLLREELPEIISVFKEYGSFDDLSLTTNGYLLKSLSEWLKEAGLDRLNVSLHTLKPEVYKFITGVNAHERVLQGIEKAIQTGYKQIKINMVVMKDINDSEIPDMIEFAFKKGLVLQLIELHPVGLGKENFGKYYLSLDEVEEYLSERSQKITIRKELHNRPIYFLDNGVKVEIVRPYNNWRFCMGCTRIRISPIGELFPCINWFGPRPNIRSYIKELKTREDKIRAIMNAIKDVNKLRRPFYKPPYYQEQAYRKEEK